MNVLINSGVLGVYEISKMFAESKLFQRAKQEFIVTDGDEKVNVAEKGLVVGKKKYTQTQYKLSKNAKYTKRMATTMDKIYSDSDIINRVFGNSTKYSNDDDADATSTAKKVTKHITPKGILNWISNKILTLLEKEDLLFSVPFFKKYFARLVMSNANSIIENSMVLLDESDKQYGVLQELSTHSSFTNEDLEILIENMDSGLRDSFEQAAKNMAFKTFFKNSNGLSRWYGDLVKKHPGWAALVSIPLPFIRMSWNMTQSIIDLSPAGFVKILCQKQQ